MKDAQEKFMQDLYNLILNQGTREWERSQLVETKNAVETGSNIDDQIAKLEATLRPLGTRHNLTPDLADFYLKMINDPSVEIKYDYMKHIITEADYQERAVFAGGCFWCMVEPFETRLGIISVLSGYIGGDIDFPTYDQVLAGYTGHVEAVEIIFDSRIVSHKELIELYWQISDPTDAFGQFQDRGSQYRPIIFVQNDQQKKIAEDSRKQLSESGKYQQPIVTEIRKATTFWTAENYHQQFYKKETKRYKRIKRTRQQFLNYQHLKSNLRIRLKK